MTPAATHNENAQLKWARKGRPESDTISQPRLAKFPSTEVETAGLPSPENGPRPFLAVAQDYSTRDNT